MFTNIERSKGFLRRTICVILVLIIIGTSAMIYFIPTPPATLATPSTPVPPPATPSTPVPPPAMPSTPVPLPATSKNLCTNTNGPSVYIICTWDVEEDIFISGNIHRKGQWEPDITQKLYSVLKQDKNITFIDIGANIGYFSLLAASVGQSVISVEPWKLNIEKLQNSIHKNKFEGKITILNNAVSNNRRVIRIHAPIKHNKGATRLLSDPTLTGFSVFSAAGITFNDLTNYIHTKDIVIKMDIEGSECRALEKSDMIFEKFHVLFISMEWGVMRMYRQAAGTACPLKYMERMVKMLTKRDFIPYGFPDNLPLNPVKYKHWTHFNIYWKPKQKRRTLT